MHYNLFTNTSKTGREASELNSFFEASITLIQKSDQSTMEKENYKRQKREEREQRLQEKEIEKQKKQ